MKSDKHHKKNKLNLRESQSAEEIALLPWGKERMGKLLEGRANFSHE
jgi:hypothetical protein